MKSIWIVVCSILIIICAIYVPWVVPVKESKNLDIPISLYNWSWVPPKDNTKWRVDRNINYTRVFLNILISGCACTVGYFVTFAAIRRRNTLSKWDELLDGIDYIYLRNYIVDIFKKIEEEERFDKGDGASIYKKEFANIINEFVKNPCKRTAVDLLNAAPFFADDFLNSKKWQSLDPINKRR